MTWSLGEISALATKAARGSGMEWGLAEEAGYAVKWLQRRELPGVAALCRYLSWRQSGTLSAWPDKTGDRGHYCPIAIGAAYGDGAFGDEVQLPRIRLPLLLIPFVALRAFDKSITVSMDNTVFGLTRDGFGHSANSTAILVNSSVCNITTKHEALPLITSINDIRWPRVPETTTDCIKVLNKFAKNTYAPATEASRLAGAGAALNDDD